MEKTLEFNGRNILFIAKDGQYWVAIKPICEALRVDYIRQFKNLKEDIILSQLLSEQTMVAADNKLRKMVSIPEKYVYGWLFRIQSSSPDLLTYQRECYDILYDHFKGTITKRQELLMLRTTDDSRINDLKSTLQDNPDFIELQKLVNRKKAYAKQLKVMDTELIQLDMFIES